MADPTSAPEPPITPVAPEPEAWLSDRISDGLVLAFTVWTVICHATVLAGGSLHHLLAVAAFCVATWLSTVWWCRARAKSPMRPPNCVAPSRNQSPETEEAGAAPRRRLSWWVLSTATTAVVIYAVSGNLTTAWVIGAAGLITVGVAELTSEPRVSSPCPRRSWKLTLYVLCALCAILTLVAHRRDSDDSVYVNLAVTVADEPARPLMTRDSLHGLPEMGSRLLQVYRVHTLEVLEGALSYLTGLHVLDVAHWIVPVLAALLVPLASARLLRLLIPGRWIWGVVVALAVLLTVGNTHRIYGNFSFVRLHQGKAILLSALVPLLIVYGLEFALRPDRRRWLRLAAGQIAAVGMSSTGLWLAPLVAGLAVVCGIDYRRRPLRTLLLGASSAMYVLFLALYIQQTVYPSRSAAFRGTTIQDLCGDSPRCLELLAQVAEIRAQRQGSATADDLSALREELEGLQQRSSARLMELTVEGVLGQGHFALLSLLVIFGGWTIAQTPIQRRFLVVFPLGFLLLWNPFRMSWVVANITGNSTYWRVLWVLPLPVMLGIVLTMPIEARRLRKVPAGLRIITVLALAMGVIYWCTTIYTLSAANGVRLGSPGWKVPRDDFSVACFMAEQVPAGSFVLAPESIALWMTTLHRHPFPLLVRGNYLMRLRDQLGSEELRRRRRLAGLVSGTVTSAPEYRQGLDCPQ